MKTAFSILLGFIPLWLFSALLHSIDIDVKRAGGINNPRMLISVTIIALILGIFASAPLVAFHKLGRRGYWVGLLIVSCILSIYVAAFGISATNLQGWLLAFTVIITVCATIFFLATVPGVLALRSYRSRFSR
ncbi:hypothetical protein DSM106972_058400 [Dulcicalothrix desertica PCC 7102]|uniref:Uncharacterized protein n=1 Tax=Dulcicalothrix desertica PCC 7102 TaxID=232991 RepID=A0A3S1AJU6_9CYAN|nr:hypothetical protein [Dulcicalothrix desertica]RUT02362.1 hypothetical protein DSM106972_058400 [Dulcicalothrix desertica PCC 7102]TWH55414.1 hypothetical protein CAL7102_03548 [Dulcicalothrix desertica PCC 7102]